MSDLESTGQVAPAVASEATPPAAAPVPQGTTAETPAEGTAPAADEQEPVAPKTYSEEEVQERIERATAKAAAKAERRAFREASQIMQRQQPQVSHQQVEAEPNRDNFATDADYIKAMVKHGVEQQTRGQREEQARERQTATNAKTDNLYREAAKIPGFDRDVFDELPLTPVMGQALVDSDVPAKLMAHLTAHPDEVDRIAALTPARQAAEIGKLETKLSTAAPVKAPKAPAPISTVGNGNASTVKNLNTANFDDFKKQMKAAGSRWIR